MTCDLCGRELEVLTYTCSRCGDEYCSTHRLPESHDCIGLKLEKAERNIKRMEGENVPWFTALDSETWGKSGTSDAIHSGIRRTDSELGEDVHVQSEDKYRKRYATHNCKTCTEPLFTHEAVACADCGAVYCETHLQQHRPYCEERDSSGIESSKTVSEHYQYRTKEKQNERKTRRDELEQERKKRYSSPNVNPDGSLSKPNYEEDIQSISENPGAHDEIPRKRSTWTTLFIIATTIAILVIIFGL